MSVGHFRDALAALHTGLERTGAPFMLIGGLAVVAHGVPRPTDDLDATAWAPGLDLDDLIAALAASDVVGRIPDMREFAAQTQVLLLRHAPSGIPIEVALAWLPFEEEALQRAVRLRIGGVPWPTATVDDLIIYKALAWRDRDRIDVQRLLRVVGHRVGRQRILRIVQQLAEAIEAPERVALLETLLDEASDA